MTLHLYSQLLAKINGEMLVEHCAITVVQACNKPDRITISSMVPASGLEFNAHDRIGQTVHVSLHVTTGRSFRGCMEPGQALIAYDARIVAAELNGSTSTTACSSFTCEALPLPRPEET